MSSGMKKLWQNFSESFTLGIISVSLLICLIVAMFKPEKF